MGCYTGFPTNSTEAFYRLIPYANNNFKNGYLIAGHCSAEDGDIIEVSRVDKGHMLGDRGWQNVFRLPPIFRATNFNNCYKTEILIGNGYCSATETNLRDDNDQWSLMPIVPFGKSWCTPCEFDGTEHDTIMQEIAYIFDIPERYKRCSI